MLSRCSLACQVLCWGPPQCCALLGLQGLEGWSPSSTPRHSRTCCSGNDAACHLPGHTQRCQQPCQQEQLQQQQQQQQRTQPLQFMAIAGSMQQRAQHPCPAAAASCSDHQRAAAAATAIQPHQQQQCTRPFQAPGPWGKQQQVIQRRKWQQWPVRPVLYQHTPRGFHKDAQQQPSAHAATATEAAQVPKRSSNDTGADSRSSSSSRQKVPGASLSTLPNLLSLSRVAMGPGLAAAIAAQQWPLAVGLTAAAGVTDWLDGYLARRLGHTSKLGSYLDPLADKIFVATAVGTMGYLGMLPGWLAVLVVGRDSTQVAGMFWYRLRMFGGRWPGAVVFFDVDHEEQQQQEGGQQQGQRQQQEGQQEGQRQHPAQPIRDTSPSTSEDSSRSIASSASSVGSAAGSGGGSCAGLSSTSSAAAAARSHHQGHHSHQQQRQQHRHQQQQQQWHESPGRPAGTAVQLPMIRPLLVSKANTALVMVLVAACMGHEWQGLPGQDVLDTLEYAAAGTTLASAAVYARLHWRGQLLVGSGQGSSKG